MTVSISSIKADAKKALKGNWLMAIISGLTLLFPLLMRCWIAAIWGD
jgi:uncharacterized membrane protein